MLAPEQKPQSLRDEQEVVAYLTTRPYDLLSVGTETTEDYLNEELRRHYNMTADHEDRVKRENEEPDRDLTLNIATAIKKAALLNAKEHYASNKHVLQTLAIKEDEQRNTIKS